MKSRADHTMNFYNKLHVTLKYTTLCHFDEHQIQILKVLLNYSQRMFLNNEDINQNLHQW